MTSPQKRKGDSAERAAATILTDELGVNARRALGAGRQEDVGDIFGIPFTVVQVADRQARFYETIREKPLEAARQRRQAGVTHAASFIKLRGGPATDETAYPQWRVVLTVEQWATLWREAVE